MTEESSQILNDNQINYTFCQQSSRDNPETLISTLVDEPNKNNDNTTQQEMQHQEQMFSSEVKGNNKQGKKLTYKSIFDSHQSNYNLTHTPRNKNMKMHTHQTQEDQHDETDMHGYKELTFKLQTALNKISSSKKVFNKTVGSNNDIIHRFENCEEKKKRQICKKKEQMELLKIKQLRDKPTINKNSQKITKEIGYEPIYTRFEKILQSKKKKVEEQQQIKKKHQEDQQVQFIQEYNRHVKKPENARTYDQYFNQMQRWKEKRMEQNRQKYQIKQQKELEGITFQPTLNSKSKKLVSSQQRLPIEQRGLVKKKVQPEVNCTFTPNISSRKIQK